MVIGNSWKPLESGAAFKSFYAEPSNCLTEEHLRYVKWYNAFSILCKSLTHTSVSKMLSILPSTSTAFREALILPKKIMIYRDAGDIGSDDEGNETSPKVHRTGPQSSAVKHPLTIDTTSPEERKKTSPAKTRPPGSALKSSLGRDHFGSPGSKGGGGGGFGGGGGGGGGPKSKSNLERDRFGSPGTGGGGGVGFGGGGGGGAPKSGQSRDQYGSGGGGGGFGGGGGPSGGALKSSLGKDHFGSPGSAGGGGGGPTKTRAYEPASNISPGHFGGKDRPREADGRPHLIGRFF